MIKVNDACPYVCVHSLDGWLREHSLVCFPTISWTLALSHLVAVALGFNAAFNPGARLTSLDIVALSHNNGFFLCYHTTKKSDYTRSLAIEVFGWAKN